MGFSWACCFFFFFLIFVVAFLLRYNHKLGMQLKCQRKFALVAGNVPSSHARASAGDGCIVHAWNII